MNKMSLWDKWKIFFEVSKSSYWFIIVIILLIAMGIIFITTSKRTVKRNKMIYIAFTSIILILLLIIYNESIANIFDYMMNNLFIAIYFPNLAIYFAAIVIMNIIVWISLFHFHSSELIKRLNITIYVFMNYLLALTLSIIKTNNLDVFTQSSVYNNQKATALIELSSIIFIVWIIFLIVYKIILIYVRKEYKPNIKRVIVKKVEKILPENFIPIDVPKYIYGQVGKRIIPENKIVNPIANMNNFQLQVPTPTTIEVSGQDKIDKNEKLTKEFEKLLTIDDYRLLLKLLKEEKEKEQIENLKKQEQINRTIEEEKAQLLKQRQIQQERERKERERLERMRLEQEKLEQERLEKIRLAELKRKELEKEQEKYTELELLYRSIQ